MNITTLILPSYSHLAFYYRIYLIMLQCLDNLVIFLRRSHSLKILMNSSISIFFQSLTHQHIVKILIQLLHRIIISINRTLQPLRLSSSPLHHLQQTSPIIVNRIHYLHNIVHQLLFNDLIQCILFLQRRRRIDL